MKTQIENIKKQIVKQIEKILLKYGFVKIEKQINNYNNIEEYKLLNIKSSFEYNKDFEYLREEYIEEILLSILKNEIIKKLIINFETIEDVNIKRIIKIANTEIYIKGN